MHFRDEQVASLSPQDRGNRPTWSQATRRQSRCSLPWLCFAVVANRNRRAIGRLASTPIAVRIVAAYRGFVLQSSRAEIAGQSADLGSKRAAVRVEVGLVDPTEFDGDADCVKLVRDAPWRAEKARGAMRAAWPSS